MMTLIPLLVLEPVQDLGVLSTNKFVRIFEHNFVENKEKFRRLGIRKSRNFDAVFGKICRKDVREGILNRF